MSENEVAQRSNKITYFLLVVKGGNREDRFVQLSDEITHFLQVDNDGEIVRSCLCTYPTRSRTLCGRTKAERR